MIRDEQASNENPKYKWKPQIQWPWLTYNRKTILFWYFGPSIYCFSIACFARAPNGDWIQALNVHSAPECQFGPWIELDSGLECLDLGSEWWMDSGSTLNPQTLNPKSPNPKSSNPKSLNPKILKPQTLNPQTLNPQTLNPKSPNPKSPNPKP